MKKIAIAAAAVFGVILVSGAVLIFGFPGATMKLMRTSARFSAGVSKDRVKVGAHEWAYLRGGSGGPVLFIHGFGDKDNFGSFPGRFTSKYDVIIPDLPGFGESSYFTAAGYGMEEQVDRLKAFVKKLGIGKFYLVGHAFGGGIAAMYAAKYPGDVLGLVLMSPMGIDTGREDDSMRILQKMELADEVFFYFKNTKQVDTFFDLCFHKKPDVPERFKRAMVEEAKPKAGRIEKIYRDSTYGGFDFMRPRLKDVKARTLVIWGKDDKFAHPSCAGIFCGGISKCGILLLDECGHVPYSEKAEETGKAMLDFFSK
jgi:pimeloyl-ACP methyl ester carboxylesterase